MADWRTEDELNQLVARSATLREELLVAVQQKIEESGLTLYDAMPSLGQAVGILLGRIDHKDWSETAVKTSVLVANLSKMVAICAEREARRHRPHLGD